MYDGYGVFQRAVGLLPLMLRERALALDRKTGARVEELRLRVGQPLGLTLPEGESCLGNNIVSVADLEYVLDAATEFSRYTAVKSLRQGYLTAPGGFRVGVCGKLIGGEGGSMEDISSLAVRIPRPCPGTAADILPCLVEEGRLVSTLILSPPGGGKTTMLRDLVRQLADGTVCCPALRVALVDERGELAATYRGKPQLDVGRQTDVLEGLPKAEAIPILLRAMNPQVIALDEIALLEDAAAVESAAGCGAVLLATIHAPTVEELHRRSLGRTLLQSGVFRRAVIIDCRDGQRWNRVEALS